MEDTDFVVEALERAVAQAGNYLEAARVREGVRDERLKRIEAIVLKLADRTAAIDTKKLADNIVNDMINGWRRSKFTDPWNYLTTQGREDARACIEEFLGS